MERIKERVEEKEGIPPQQQRLIYSGKQMWGILLCSYLHMISRCSPANSNHLLCCLVNLRNDEKTAADYKIQGGSVLHLVLALRGGSTNHSCCLPLSSTSWVAVIMGSRPSANALGVCHRLTMFQRRNLKSSVSRPTETRKQNKTKINRKH